MDNKIHTNTPINSNIKLSLEAAPSIRVGDPHLLDFPRATDWKLKTCPTEEEK